MTLSDILYCLIGAYFRDSQGVIKPLKCLTMVSQWKTEYFLTQEKARHSHSYEQLMEFKILFSECKTSLMGSTFSSKSWIL